MADEHLSDDAWEKGMKLAFDGGKARQPAADPSASVTHASIHLRQPEGVDSPIIKPSPDEETDKIGRYRIVGEIARGGVGVILQARDAALGRDVAMKVLRAAHEDNALLVARFIEEAQIGGQLQHPGVVPVYEVGEDEARRPYFTMKLVRGRTLSALLRERKTVAEERHRFLRVFEQACETMAYAHARGVVHRDLKSANIMVGAFGEVQILDWGFAKVLSQGGVADERASRGEAITTVRSGPDGSDSVSGSALGTPAYMAPEQALGNVEALDERTDVFCLGAVLCEILTGKPPYMGDDARELLRRAAVGDLDDARTRIEECGADRELIDLALDCLRTAKGERPANAGEVASRVTDYLAEIAERAHAAEVEAAEARARVAEERKRRRLTIVVASLVMLGLGLAGFGYWTRAGERADNDRKIGRVLSAAAAHRQRGDWTAALAQLERAESLVDAAPTSDDTAARVAERLAEYRRLRKDAELLKKIESIRSQEDLDPGESSDGYEQAFKEYGIDVDAMSATEIAAALLKGGRERGKQLARALDDWASRIPRGPPPRGLSSEEREGFRKRVRAARERVRKLIQAAQEADEDVWRYRLRAAILDGDRDALISLANDVKAQSREPESILLLAQGLRSIEDGRKLSREVLRHGYRHHPGDYWINFTLAINALIGGGRPRHGRRGSRSGGGRGGRGGHWKPPEIRAEDIVLGERHSRIAMSLRPESPEPRIFLALFLRRRAELAGGDTAEFVEVRQLFEEAMKRAPPLGKRVLEVVLLDLDGKRDEARAVAATLITNAELPPHQRMLLASILPPPPERRDKKNR